MTSVSTPKLVFDFSTSMSRFINLLLPTLRIKTSSWHVMGGEKRFHVRHRRHQSPRHNRLLSPRLHLCQQGRRHWVLPVQKQKGEGGIVFVPTSAICVAHALALGQKWTTNIYKQTPHHHSGVTSEREVSRLKREKRKSPKHSPVGTALMSYCALWERGSLLTFTQSHTVPPISITSQQKLIQNDRWWKVKVAVHAKRPRPTTSRSSSVRLHWRAPSPSVWWPRRVRKRMSLALT